MRMFYKTSMSNNTFYIYLSCLIENIFRTQFIGNVFQTYKVQGIFVLSGVKNISIECFIYLTLSSL